MLFGLILISGAFIRFAICFLDSLSHAPSLVGILDVVVYNYFTSVCTQKKHIYREEELPPPPSPPKLLLNDSSVDHSNLPNESVESEKDHVVANNEKANSVSSDDFIIIIPSPDE